jgi:hypothetical protein
MDWSSLLANAGIYKLTLTSELKSCSHWDPNSECFVSWDLGVRKWGIWVAEENVSLGDASGYYASVTKVKSSEESWVDHMGFAYILPSSNNGKVLQLSPDRNHVPITKMTEFLSGSLVMMEYGTTIYFLIQPVSSFTRGVVMYAWFSISLPKKLSETFSMLTQN